MKTCTLIFPLLLFASANAQTLLDASHETNWYMEGDKENILYMSDNEAILPIRQKKASGIAMIDEQANEKWKALVDGYMLGACKFKNNILVIYEKNNNNPRSFSTITEVFGMLVDPSGKTISNKSILETEAKNYVAVKLLKDQQGQFKQLLLRYTKWTIKNDPVGRKMQSLALTEKIRSFTLADDLSATEVANFGVNPDVVYFNSMVADNNDLLIFWFNKNATFVLEQFRDGSVNNRLSVPLDLSKNSGVSVVWSVNKNNPSEILCALKYYEKKYIIKTILLNLETREVKSIDEELTGAYRKKIEDESEVVGSKKHILPSFFEDLSPVGIEFYNDQIIVVKEIRAGVGNGGYSSNAVISVLNRDLSVQKSFLAEKEFNSVLSIPVLSYRIADDKLQFISNNKKLNSGKLVFGEIDLKQLKWTRIVGVKRAKGAESSGKVLDGSAVLWFANQAVVPHVQPPTGIYTIAVFTYFLQAMTLDQ